MGQAQLKIDFNFGAIQSLNRYFAELINKNRARDFRRKSYILVLSGPKCEKMLFLAGVSRSVED